MVTKNSNTCQIRLRVIEAVTFLGEFHRYIYLVQYKKSKELPKCTGLFLLVCYSMPNMSSIVIVQG